MEIYYLSKFIKKSEDIIEKIKKSLYIYEDFENYNEFVDNQSMGDCQLIVSFIKSEFPNVISVFGEIETDDFYIDEYGDEQNLITHHWVEIDGEIYDFSKGTLLGYVEFDSIYDPEVNYDEIDKYNPIRKK